MATKVGINGFGRIGRQVLKAMLERASKDLEVVAINDLFDVETNAHLFMYDSTYGKFQGDVNIKEGNLLVNGHTVKVLAERDPAKLPWKDMGVDIVIEATGIFTDAIGDAAKGKPGANVHIQSGGAKKVIISAPAKNEDLTIVLGVNDSKYDTAKHNVISNASCTTNCLAPAAKVVHEKFNIQYGSMVTVHSYTNDQVILDQGHRKELRRSRSAGLNIIPTSTGAARAVALVIPELKGKFDGYSLRVPSPTVSVVDFNCTVSKTVTNEELQAAFVEAANGPLKGILGVIHGKAAEPLVSTDFRGDDRSSIVDLKYCGVLGGNLVKVVSWYDNEWGYSCRTADLAVMVAKKL